MMPTTDWDIIIKGNISLLWCQWSTNPKNGDKKLSELLKEFHSQYNNIDPLNIGSLLMASYILFVYPQQSEFNSFDFSRVDTNHFTVHQGTSTTNKDRFCSRIRNALAHGRFAVNLDQIELSDQKTNGSDPFRTTILLVHFGEFINNFMDEVKRQHFER
jgi:hypothetical protein